MSELHLPWLELAILIPLIGAVLVGRLKDADQAARWCVWITSLTLVTAVGAWQDFDLMHVSQADDKWHLLKRLFGRETFIMDQLSAPKLALVALLYFLTTLATMRTKIRRFSFAGNLVSEALVLAAISCNEPWGIIGLLAAGTVPPYLELRARSKPTRVYVLHMALFVVLMVVGWIMIQRETDQGIKVHSLWAIMPLLVAILIRSGIAPLHCWMTDLFEHATFGTALLFVTPLMGAYAAVRLVLPIAPDWVLQSMGFLSLLTAVYAAGMALVQREARRFFCYLFLSHSALVLVGLEMVTPLGLTGGLCVWLSVGVSLGGLGLTLRSVEARIGRLTLTSYHGLHEHMPILSACFVLTGLGSVGFPGTLGFIGTELLVDGAVETYPHVGIAVVVAAALNSIAIVRAYFLIFTGTRHVSSVSLRAGNRERVAVLTLMALILIGGLYPQPGVASRHHAAEEMLERRTASGISSAPPEPQSDGEHDVEEWFEDDNKDEDKDKDINKSKVESESKSKSE